MADSINHSTRPVDEKAVMQHHEYSGTSQYSHQEMTGPGSEEAMHESDKDIPVGLGRLICGCDNTDRSKDDIPSFHGLYCHGFPVDRKPDSSLPVWYVKNHVKAVI